MLALAACHAPARPTVMPMGDSCRTAGPDVWFAQDTPIIKGSVRDPDRKALAGIDVQIENDSGPITVTTTDVRGRYSFAGIRDGSYTIKVFYGSSVASSERVVIAGQQTTLDRTLDLAKLPPVPWCV
jgi:hypothetical protein